MTDEEEEDDDQLSVEEKRRIITEGYDQLTRCFDCGAWGEMTGHMECPHPQDHE